MGQSDVVERLRAPAAMTQFGRYCALVAVVALLPRLVFIFAFPTGGGDWDIYSTVAENIIRGCGVSLSPPTGAECVPHFGGNHLPGYPAFVALTWSVAAHSDVAVRLLQTVLYIAAIMRLMAACFELSKMPRFVLAVGLVMALSPLQVAWPRYTQTETLSLAAVIWFFAEILASFAQRRLRVLPLAICLALAVFIRLDAVLLCVPLAVAGFLIETPRLAVQRGAVIAALVALPLAAWAVRNAAVGLPSIFPAPMVLPNNLPAPSGYLAWGATWVSQEYQRMGWAWPVTRMQYRGIAIDPRAYDDARERQRVETLLAELGKAEGEAFPPAIDAQFAALARERTERSPLRTYVWLPLARAAALWTNPFSSFGWPNELPSAVGHQQRLETAQSSSRLLDLARQYPIQAATKALTGAYRLALLAGFVLIAVISLARQRGPYVGLVGVVAAWIAARTLFFALTNNVETRYTVVTTPAIELVVVLTLCWIVMRGRAAAASERLEL